MNQAFIYNQMFLSVEETRNIKYLSIYIEGKQPLSIYCDPVLGSCLLWSPAICPVAAALQPSLYELTASTFSQSTLPSTVSHRMSSPGNSEMALLLLSNGLITA